MSSKSTETHYGSVAVRIHWISALLVFVLIGSGFRSGFSEDAASKAAALRVHLPVAGLLLVLTLARLIWWWRFDVKPQSLPSVPDWQDRVAHWTHRGLYGLLFVLLGSGIAMSAMSGLPFALFGDAPLPDLAALPPRGPHGIAARVLAGLVLLHAGAALYHHYGLKDATLRRMWLAKSR